MRYSIIHPAARPERLARVARKWFERATKPEKLWYIAAFHVEQYEEFLEFLPGFLKVGPCVAYHCSTGDNHPTLNGRSSFVDNANAAARASFGDVLVLATDDLEPQPAWDSALEAIAFDWEKQNAPRRFAETPLIVWPSSGNAGADRRPLISHPIMTRARYKQQSWLFCPAYSGMYSDNDLTERALRDRVVIDARQKLTLKHDHPLYRGESLQADRVYAWQNAPEEYNVGHATFCDRREIGFPIGEHWQSIGQYMTAAGELAEKGEKTEP